MSRYAHIEYTLLCDGSSDRALIPIIDWSIRERYPQLLPSGTWIDPATFHMRRSGLVDKIATARRLYPRHILFIHRDAERVSWEERYAEIEAAATQGAPYIGIVPVRMTEAWLLSDEQAIRRAAGNPYSKIPLPIPARHQWESLPDPKLTLHELIRIASELSGRRLKKLHIPSAIHRVAELTQDFAALRQLSAFQHFESALSSLLSR